MLVIFKKTIQQMGWGEHVPILGSNGTLEEIPA
jgi:hypothetical protein